MDGQQNERFDTTIKFVSEAFNVNVNDALKQELTG